MKSDTAELPMKIFNPESQTQQQIESLQASEIERMREVERTD